MIEKYWVMKVISWASKTNRNNWVAIALINARY